MESFLNPENSSLVTPSSMLVTPSQPFPVEVTSAVGEKLPNSTEFEFNRRLLLNVIAYSVMFVIGVIGNVVVFVAALRQHASPENHGRNNVHIMVVHLTIADLIVALVVMPLEIGWRLSVQW